MNVINQQTLQLILKSFFKTNNYSFIKSNKNNLYMYINYKKIYILCLHLRLSQFLYTTQLIDVFAYNLINSRVSAGNNIRTQTENALIINFNNFKENINLVLLSITKESVQSVEDLFLNATWLEREYSEMNGITIYNKTDTRNLLLQYNDTTSPLLKATSSLGFFELYYNIVFDAITRTKNFKQ